jgi:hypothetical protein
MVVTWVKAEKGVGVEGRNEKGFCFRKVRKEKYVCEALGKVGNLGKVGEIDEKRRWSVRVFT